MQSGRVTLRCHNSPRWETEASECEWRHAPETRGGFWEILKKSVSWDETCLGGRRLVFACSRRHLWRVPHVLGVQMKKPELKDCTSLSLCRRTFKLKGDEKFRTWTKNSLRDFQISRFLCSVLYIYIWTLYVYFVYQYLAMVHIGFEFSFLIVNVLFSTTPFLLYLYQILDTTNWE